MFVTHNYLNILLVALNTVYQLNFSHSLCIFVYCKIMLSFLQLRQNLDKKDKKKKKKKDKKERKGEKSRKDKKHKRKSSDSDEEDNKKHRYGTSNTPRTVDCSSSSIQFSFLSKTKLQARSTQLYLQCLLESKMWVLYKNPEPWLTEDNRDNNTPCAYTLVIVGYLKICP